MKVNQGVTFAIGLLFITSLALGQTGNYRSITSGPWGTPETWERDADSNGSFEESPSSVAPTAPGTAGTIIIRNGHVVNVAAAVTIDQTTIESGGELVIDATFALTLNAGAGNEITIDAGGTLTNNGTINFVSLSARQVVVNGTYSNNGTTSGIAAGELTFNSGGTYNHDFTDGGTIPIASWNANSNTVIRGYGPGSSTAPTGRNQSFGNFFWDCPSQDESSSFDLAGQPASVQGNFIIDDTGTGNVIYAASGTPSLNVGGDFVVNAGTFGFSVSGTSGPGTINVIGDLSVNGGYVQFADDQDLAINVGGDFSFSSGDIDFSATTANTDLNLQGNFTHSGGNIFASGGVLNENFVGASTQTYSSSISPTGTFNYYIDPGATVVLNNASFFGGTGTFILDGRIAVASTHASGAIQTGTSNGNIRVSGTRTYNPGSTIIYNGGAAQSIGNGHPTTSGVNCEINNSLGVSLAANTTIGGNLTLIAGSLSVGIRTLTLGGSFTPNGNSINVASSSNLTINGTGTFGTLALSGSTSINNLVLNRTSSGSVTLGGNLTTLGTFTHTAGALVVGSNTFTISGAYGPTSPDDLSVTNSSTIVVDGSGALPSDVGFSGTALGTLTLNRSGATLPTTSSITITNLNLTSGTFSNGSGITMATGGTITRTAGTMATSPNNTTNAYNVVYTSGTIDSGPELPSNTTTALANLSKTGTGTLTLTKAITVTGSLTLSSGSFAAGTNAIDLQGNFVSNATSTLTSSAVTFSGNTVLSGSTPPTFGAITISGTFTPSISYQVNGNLVNNGTLNAGSGTITFGGTSLVNGSATSSFNHVTVSGTLTAAAATMNISGNFSNNGTFNHNNGTIVFNGTTTINGSNTTSLYHTNITGTLTAPPSTLNIAGNLSNSGTFNNNSGTIVFNGTTSSQSVTGSYNMNNFNVSNPSGVNNNGTISLSGTLTLVSSGVFDADGAGSGVLIIRSTAVNAGGRIAELPTPANFSGLVTVERFINGPDSWRYLSMPITNGNAGTWQSTFPVTGSFSNASPNGVNGVVNSTSPSIYFWNSATQAYVAVGSGGTTASTSLSNLTGYSAYTYLTGNFTISARGNIRTGNANIPIAASGYALVPNPYPSAIDWDNINRTGLSSTMFLRTANNVFATYVAGGPATNAPYGGWAGEIATGQAFWIQSSGATVLNLTESAKTGSQYQFLRDAEPANYVRIVLSSASQRDEALVWFVEGASSGFDDTFDALKMRNGHFEPGEEPVSYLNLSTISEADGFDYAINSLAPLSCSNSMKLRVRDVTQGPHSLSFKDLQTMKLGYQVVLVDHFLSTESVVTDNFEYSFDVTDDEASYGDLRFSLRFAVQGSVQISAQKPGLSIVSRCDTDHIEVSIESQKDVFYQFLKGGETVGDMLEGTGGTLTFHISKNSLSKGENTLALRASTGKGCEHLTYGNILNYNFAPSEAVSITANDNKLVSSAESGNQWFKDGLPIAGATGQIYEVVESGEYSVEASFDGCQVVSEKITFRITGSEEPEQQISVYPVPASDRVTVILPEMVRSGLRGISMSDSRGARVLDQESYSGLLAGDVNAIDLTNLPSGVYLLSIISDKAYHFKIIKK